MKHELENIKRFTASYIETAIWADGVEGEFYDLAEGEFEKAEVECTKFFEKVKQEFTADEAEAILTYEGSDVGSLAGHDFWLTRNGHGAGFWDKPIYDDLAENGMERLTKIAKEFGVSNVFVVDNTYFFE